MFLTVMEKLAVDITEESLQNLTEDVLTDYQQWLFDGGQETMEGFTAKNGQTFWTTSTVPIAMRRWSRTERSIFLPTQGFAALRPPRN